MARDFVAANSERFNHATALIGVPPFTMACWFRSNDITTLYTLMTLAELGGDDGHSLELRGDVGGDPIGAYSVNAGVIDGNAQTSTGYSADTWHHAGGVWTATNDRAAFLDGGGKGTNTNDVTGVVVDETFIGRRTMFVDAFMDGRIAEAGMWNVALTDDEMRELASGVSPLRVRMSSLVGYWPLFAISGDAPDYSGNGNPMTDNNTVGVADHAPVAPPFGFGLGWQGAFTAAAGGGGPARRRVGIGAGQAIRR